MRKNKIFRGNASQFFVAGELCRRGFSAVVTLGNNPNTDILCSNADGTKFVHIQVKTYQPGEKKCRVGIKAENNYGDNFFWVLGGIPYPESNKEIEFYIIPAKEMSINIAESHRLYLETPGRNGQQRNDSDTRMVVLPPLKSRNGWDISEFKNRWDLIEEKLKP